MELRIVTCYLKKHHFYHKQQLAHGQKTQIDIFPKEDMHTANRHMKRCSTSRETESKTTMRYYLISVRMAIIKKVYK